MRWVDLIGHEQQKQWLERALSRGRLANTFLFLGPDGVGKKTFARLLAKSLLCHRCPPDRLEPCYSCENCAQVNALTHPDLIEVSKPADKQTMPLELIIGPPKALRSEGFCHDIGLRPYSGRRKVAILDDADSLEAEGANALLKTLEEPPQDSVLILLSVSLQRQLPTIRSRCQIIRFAPLSPEQLAELILQQGIVAEPSRALEIARQSDGGLGMARTLADDELADFRASLLERLSAERIDFIDLAKTVAAICESAGKEAILRRPRTKLILKMAADFYRDLCSHLQGGPVSADPRVREAVNRLASRWTEGIEGAVQCWIRCLDAIAQVDRNANQLALMEEWSSLLASKSRC